MEINKVESSLFDWLGTLLN